jgi:hypothetical protein
MRPPLKTAMSQEQTFMNSSIYDLRVAEAHCRELQAEAEHDRLVRRAIAANRGQRPRSFFARTLSLLRGRDPNAPPPDPSKN